MDTTKAPTRIQRKRTKDWRMGDAVYVGRGSKWGNPFAAKIKSGETGLATMSRQMLVDDYLRWMTMPLTKIPGHKAFGPGGASHTSYLGIDYEGRPAIESIRAKLAGKNLACSCPLDQPCHADVLLEIANQKEKDNQ